jgi:transposase
MINGVLEKSSFCHRMRQKEEKMINKKLIERGKFVNRGVLVVGIDIGKGKHVAVGTSLEYSFTKPFYIRDCRKSFELFEEKIKEWKKRLNCKEEVIGFESTGHYWKPLGYYLKEKNNHLVEVSTSHTKKAKEMMDNSPLKCDSKDARVIGDLIRQGKILTPIFPEGRILNLREMMHTRENLVKDRTSVLNRLHKIVDVTFPERREIIKDIKGKTSIFLLKKVPFPENIIEKGLKWLKEKMRKKSRGRYSNTVAELLYKLAKDTIGIREGIEGFRWELKILLPRLERLNREIEEIEFRVKEILGEIHEAKYLMSISGIGEITAATVIAESGGLGRYEKVESVLKVAGLNLYEISSGKHEGEKHITKRSRSLMRQKLYFAALQQAREGMPLYTFYRKLTEENGVKRTKALIAVARKLLKIMFALVRDKREFVLDYEYKGLKEAA